MAQAASAESLEVLFQRCRDGDEAGFAQVYRRLGRSLYGTALRMLRQAEEAEDALQEAFMSFYRKHSELDPAQAGAWLRRVLINGCLDRLRRRRRRPEAELAEDVLQSAPRSDGLRMDLERATARLPERARLVFLLHDVEGFRHREVAELMGVTEGATKSQLFRARGLLRGYLNEAPGGTS
jgi:RNA polymerase sigma-70 factor (ECF subfamily)